jgi:hypothetical protein
MRSAFFALLVSAVLLAASCTGNESTPDTMATPGHTSPSPTVRTFVLARGQNRLNLKPGIATPGDIIACGRLRLRVPADGTHQGSSGRVWAITTSGTVSMGCRTKVVWGSLTAQ